MINSLTDTLYVEVTWADVWQPTHQDQKNTQWEASLCIPCWTAKMIKETIKTDIHEWLY